MASNNPVFLQSPHLSELTTRKARLLSQATIPAAQCLPALLLGPTGRKEVQAA